MTNDDEWTDWIPHHGDLPPVDKDEFVHLMYWHGHPTDEPVQSKTVCWIRMRTPRDIIAYRRKKSAVEATQESAISEQIGGDHYKKLGAYQPVEVLKRWLTPDEFRGWMKGTAIVYLARERDKNGDEDIAKAEHTLRLWKELK